jgi:hypothetical protein
MEHHEVGYAPSTRFVREGEQSLAFMVRVDWSEKPGQKYAKGWPMISRTFETPRDWSRLTGMGLHLAEAWYHDRDRINAKLRGDVVSRALDATTR